MSLHPFTGVQNVLLAVIAVLLTCHVHLAHTSASVNRDNFNVPCSFRDSLNVTNGLYDPKTKSIRYDNTTYLPGQYGSFDYELVYEKRMPAATHYRACVCKMHKPCVPICCAIGQSLVEIDGRYVCTPNVHSDARRMMMDVLDPVTNEKTEENVLSSFGYVVSPLCERYALDPANEPKDEFQLLKDGSLLVENLTYNIHEFCLTPDFNKTGSSGAVIRVFICFPPNDVDVKFAFYPYAMLTSVPFLLATFIVYAILPELRNVHGKSLMCYLMGLAMGYTILAMVQIKLHWDPEIMCNILGYTVYTAFMSAFFWLNVISFDLWWNFRGIKGISKLGESWKFRVYSLYAWGIPCLMLGFAVFMDTMSPQYVASYLAPGIGIGACFFEKKPYTEFVYFYLPIILILISNSTFFTLTALKIRRVQAEMARVIAKEDSQRHRNHLEQEKDKYGVFLRLFLVMGVTWSTEIISWAIDGNSFFFYPTDLMNIMQGPLIFFLFVMKPKVKKLMIKRWNIWRGRKPNKFSSGARSTQTNTMTFSSANSTHHIGHHHTNSTSASADMALLQRSDNGKTGKSPSTA